MEIYEGVKIGRGMVYGRISSCAGIENNCNADAKANPVILLVDEQADAGKIASMKDRILALLFAGETMNPEVVDLAGQWGIPALAGVPAKEEWYGREAVVDADGGSLFIDPDDMVKNLVTFREQMSAQSDLLDWGLDMLTDVFF